MAVAFANASLVAMSLLLAACTTPPEQQAKPVVQLPPAELPAVPTQDELVLRSIVLMQSRLYRVAAPLLVNNAELCKSHARHLLGFAARNRYSYSLAYQAVAQKAIRLGDRLQVMDVLAGSGAARAGVLPGDVLLAVEGKPLPEGEQAERLTASILAPMVNGRAAINLTVQRLGRDTMLHVPLTRSCAFGIELGNTDHLVALSDGHRILVSRGMVQFAGTDEELAYVLAKEIAQNVLARRKSRETGAAIGDLIDNLTRIHPDLHMVNSAGGLKAMPHKQEAQADRLAFYLLARAGYGLDGVVPFVRKLAAEPNGAGHHHYGVLHPVTPSRIAAMDKSAKEVIARQGRSMALLP